MEVLQTLTTLVMRTGKNSVAKLLLQANIIERLTDVLQYHNENTHEKAFHVLSVLLSLHTYETRKALQNPTELIVALLEFMPTTSVFCASRVICILAELWRSFPELTASVLLGSNVF